MARVGLLLSGCGYADGSEVYEAVLSLLALEKGGAQVQAMAPDVPQAQVVNHYRGAEDRRETAFEISGGTRNVLVESSRIVRGKIISTREMSAHELDALVIVGGWGAVKNLSTFAVDGIDATVNPDVARLIVEMHGLGKPIGALSAGALLVAVTLKGHTQTPLQATIGNDPETAAYFAQVGAQHVESTRDDIVVDEANHLVTTPAFMLSQTAAQIEPGVNQVVARVLEMVQQMQQGMPVGGTGNTVPGLTPELR